MAGYAIYYRLPGLPLRNSLLGGAIMRGGYRNRMNGFYLIFVIAFIASSETINIRGTVSDQNNKSIPGAIIALPSRHLADTTDGAGAYSINSEKVLVNPKQPQPGAESISMRSGSIMIGLPNPAAIEISLFDVRGNRLERTLAYPASAGYYGFDLTNRPLAEKIMIIRVSVGPRVSTFCYVPLNKGTSAITPSFPRLSTMGNLANLAKIQAAIDSLIVSASGFQQKKVAIPSYEGVVNIKLDSSKLAKFSFFVISQKAVVEFSKSSRGFGGDFSFGKTGQGAGLLGADSICQCVAEKSMPGSKEKRWRAFLSVSKGPSGTQVNAADRIGQGPWYDRLGRLLAPTLKDLLNTRPTNGDQAIANDLPNEDGVPNHRPDPNKPADDNHHMITGTGADGKLYKAEQTCSDWTSKSASLKGPYGGLAWPRAGMARSAGGMGSSNWYSGMTLCGCKDSISVIEAGGPPSNCNWVGGGGGYGGFYCFALTP
jgi:hypothetical protein